MMRVAQREGFARQIAGRLVGDRHDFPTQQSLIAGAVTGGIAWGVFATLTIGAPGDQAHLDAILWPRIFAAAVISSVILVVALSVMCLSGSATRRERFARALRVIGSALVIATLSGWIILILQILQRLLVGAV